MANKRDLKKNISYICGDIASVCLFSEYNVEDSKLAQIVVSVAELQEDTRKKVSISFDKVPKSFENKKEYNKARKAYYHTAYKALLEQFNEDLKDVLGEINALNK